MKLLRALWLVIVTTARYVWSAVRAARDEHRAEQKIGGF